MTTTIKNTSKVLDLIEQLEVAMKETIPAFEKQTKKTISLPNKVKIVIQTFGKDDSRFEDGDFASVDVFLGGKSKKVTGSISVDYDGEWGFYPDEYWVNTTVYDQLKNQVIDKLWQQNKNSVVVAVQKWMNDNLVELNQKWQSVKVKEALGNLNQIKAVYS